jgi:hypothetical protein
MTLGNPHLKCRPIEYNMTAPGMAFFAGTDPLERPAVPVSSEAIRGSEPMTRSVRRRIITKRNSIAFRPVPSSRL